MIQYLQYLIVVSLWKMALILFIIISFCYLIHQIPNLIIFRQCKISDTQYNDFINNYNVIHESIQTSDGNIDACLFNSYRKPSYDDIIYLFSHGNSGWIGSVSKSMTCSRLSRDASIFIYDYKGYGKSSGIPTQNGVCQDIVSVWNYLINVKKVNPKRIIFFGHSLGTSVTIYLLNYLVKNNIENSQTAILQNGFYSMKKLFDDHVPYSGFLAKSVFDSNKWLTETNNLTSSLSITFIHSINDQLIDKQHSIDLQKCLYNNNAEIIFVHGIHNMPIYSEQVDRKLFSIHNDID